MLKDGLNGFQRFMSLWGLWMQGTYRVYDMELRGSCMEKLYRCFKNFSNTFSIASFIICITKHSSYQ